MKDARDFFRGEVSLAMEKIGFSHFLLRDFLSKLLVNNIKQRKKGGPFLARKEEALAFDFLKKSKDIQDMDEIGKSLLFSIGFFPESLKAKRRRLIGLRYYILMEKDLANRLANHKEIWLQLRNNMDRTIMVLFNVRLNFDIKKPDDETCAELINCTVENYN